MPRFKTRHGWVDFSVKSKPRKTTRKKASAKKSAKKPAKKSSAKKSSVKKPMSKKVGRWRVELKGRSVYAAGAKHTYKDLAAAKSAYKRINSVKSVESFVKRYGTKKTCSAVCKSGSKTQTKKTRKTARKSTKRRNPPSRVNAPISQAESAKIRKILKRHGYGY